MLIALTVFQMELTGAALHAHACISIACWRSPSRWCCRASPAPPDTNGRRRPSRASTPFSCSLIGRILPLFPAEPKLGPVYQHVTHFVPPEFPLLLIVPAFVLDLLWQRTGHWPLWRQSVVSGVVFLAALAAVQWPFAYFLMSPAARNWLIGAKYFAYFQRPGSHLRAAIDSSPRSTAWLLVQELVWRLRSPPSPHGSASSAAIGCGRFADERP